MTQEQKVKDRLLEVGYVDNFWAINNYILRLGAIMCQLKKQGWDFVGEFGIGADKKNYFYKLIKSPPKEISDYSINGISPFAAKETKKEPQSPLFP
jgi:hypothetical protein